MIERCGDRQHKRDGLKKWPFHMFIESLPLMLQTALLLLACGLCLHMASINTSVATLLITLTVLGVLFYLGIVVAGTSSYDCPFQTPVSNVLRSAWKKIGPSIITRLLPVVTMGKYLYKFLPWPLVLTAWQHFWGDALLLCKILHVMFWFPLVEWWNHPHHPPLPITHHTLLEDMPPLPTIPDTPLWLTPGALARLQSTNANDVRCVSWILWNITDPEALDAAIRLAGVIQWFEDRLDVEPPYELVVSTLKGCFDPSGKIYPGSRDRAYYSGRAIVWIHIRALCRSAEFANRFSFPNINSDFESLDDDLQDIFVLLNERNPSQMLAWMYPIHQESTPGSLQWTSNALLHLSWAEQSTPDSFDSIERYLFLEEQRTIPSNVFLNHLLVSCAILGWPINKEVLKIQDKYIIYCSFPLSYSCCYLAVITLIRPYLNSP